MSGLVESLFSFLIGFSNLYIGLAGALLLVAVSFVSVCVWGGRRDIGKAIPSLAVVALFPLMVLELVPGMIGIPVILIAACLSMTNHFRSWRANDWATLNMLQTVIFGIALLLIASSYFLGLTTTPEG